MFANFNDNNKDANLCDQIITDDIILNNTTNSIDQTQTNSIDQTQTNPIDQSQTNPIDQSQTNPIDQTQTNIINTINLVNQECQPEKKKRGRKPKNISTQSNTSQSNTSQSNTSQSNTSQINPQINQQINPQIDQQIDTQIDTQIDPQIDQSQQPDQIKKRGRKANTKIINLINQENNNIEIITSLIACLPLKSCDISKIMSESDSNSNSNLNMNLNINLNKQKEERFMKQNIQNAFIEIMDDTFNDSKSRNICGKCIKCSTYEDKLKKLEEEILNLKNGIMDNTTNFNKKIFESKVNFFDKSSQKWNEKTDIACWWCCHNFDHIPIGIPEFINKDTFYLFGCFCSFNCMMSYNLDLNDYKIWDRQANIYQMKNRIDPYNKITIHPAPPRQTLKMFGGPLSIKEYRESFFVLNKEFRCFFPPMISIIGIIEEENRDLSGGIKIKNNKTLDEPKIRRSTELPKRMGNLNKFISHQT